MEPGGNDLTISANHDWTGERQAALLRLRKVVSANRRVSRRMVAIGLEAEFFADFYRRIALGPDSWLALFRQRRHLAGDQPSRPAPRRASRQDPPLSHDRVQGKPARPSSPRGPFLTMPGSSPTRIVVATKVGSVPSYVTVVVGESAFLTPWRDRNLLIFVDRRPADGAHGGRGSGHPA